MGRDFRVGGLRRKAEGARAQCARATVMALPKFGKELQCLTGAEAVAVKGDPIKSGKASFGGRIPCKDPGEHGTES